MKKVILFAAMSTFVFAFSSCKKDYTCECKSNGVTVHTIPLNNQTKKDATSFCDDTENTYKTVTPTMSCEIK